MIKKLLMICPLCLLLMGCATTGRVTSLETRVNSLENKTTPQEKEQLASESTMVTTTASQEKNIPDTPTKKDIQISLKNAGYYTGSIDGKIGTKTKTSIKEFQKANGLKVDGKVGKMTWDKLKENFR